MVGGAAVQGVTRAAGDFLLQNHGLCSLLSKNSYTVPETGGTHPIHQMKAESVLYSNLDSNLSGNGVNIKICNDLCEL